MYDELFYHRKWRKNAAYKRFGGNKREVYANNSNTKIEIKVPEGIDKMREHLSANLGKKSALDILSGLKDIAKERLAIAKVKWKYTFFNARDKDHTNGLYEFLAKLNFDNLMTKENFIENFNDHKGLILELNNDIKMQYAEESRIQQLNSHLYKP